LRREQFRERRESSPTPGFEPLEVAAPSEARRDDKSASKASGETASNEAIVFLWFKSRRVDFRRSLRS